MELSVEALLGAGGFVGAPVKKQIDWPPGDKMDVYIKRPSYATAVESLQDTSGLSYEEILVLHCVTDNIGRPIFKRHHLTGFDDNGEPVMNGDEPAGHIDPRLISALAIAIGEAAKPGKAKAEK